MYEYRNLVKIFYKKATKVVALDGLTLTVRPGEFIGIVGPSGCGKSTLMNLSAGLMRPNAGEIYYDGKPVNKVMHNVGYITQKDNLLPWRTAEGNVALALEIRGTPQRDRKRLIEEYINFVGLAGFEKHYPSELSGGMRKRVTLARTLVYNPETILMDEPFGALDAQLKLIMHDEVLKLWNKTKSTVIFVTHDLMEAVTLADRVVVLTARPGRIKIVQDINLPRPRDVYKVRFTPEFGQLFELLWRHLQEDIAKGEEV